MVFGKNLKYLRLQKCMTKKYLAELAGITPMSITHYENNERTPDIQIIRRLMNALNVKLADLLTVRNDNHVYAHGEFRRNANLSIQAQEYVRESVEEYFDRFFTVIDILGNNALPAAPKCHTLTVSGDVENDAARLREYLGFAIEGPLLDLIGAMENKGVMIYLCDFDLDKFSGMNGFVDDRPFVILNSRMTTERQRSTLVHELAHLFFNYGEMNEGSIEKYATAISGAFLFPQDDARRELGLRRTSVTQDMVMVAKEYGISVLMLTKRAQVLKIISENVYKDFMIQASQHGWRKNEPSRITDERSELFEQLVIRAIGENEVSLQKGAELLKFSYDDMVKAIRLHVEA